MKPVYYPIIYTAVAHPNKGTINKLIGNGAHQYTSFE